MTSELRVVSKSPSASSHSLTMAVMRLSGMKAGRRREVLSEGIVRQMSFSMAPVRSSHRKRVRIEAISRFIDAAPILPSSVRWMIHSRTWSAVMLRGSERASSKSSHARNCPTSCL